MASILETMGLTESLRWLSSMIQLYQSDEIAIPNKFRNQVLEVKELLKSDVSGLVNSVLDFAINCALVDYTIETDNSNLTTILNNWLNKINYDYKGKIPIGIKALAKEYFRERWKGSSFLLLRTLWARQDDFILPTALWFVDGEDIVVENGNKEVRVLGEEKYYLRVSKREKLQLPYKDEERIFIQKPFTNWSSLEPVPYLIQRGIFKNLKLLEILEKKGEFIVSKALEYLMLFKKGTERMALSGNPDFIYSEEDLKKIKKDLQDFLEKRKSEKGTPVYTTAFDTEIEHLIPEYSRALSQELYTPIERRILAGLGILEIIQGYGASSRRESIFNPKPFIAEVESAIEDFKTLLMDIIYTIIELNEKDHPKYFKGINKIKVNSTLIKSFISDDLRVILRSMYDRGLLSKQTAIEVLGNLNFEIEKKRRKKEWKESLDIIFYPPVLRNVEEQVYAPDISPEDIEKIEKLEDQNKTGIEKKNYFMSKKIVECPYCKTKFDFETQEEVRMGVILCPNCHKELTQKDLFKSEIYEEAPYKNIKELPENIKNSLTKELQEIWMKVFNEALERYKNEDIARKVAWNVIKKISKKNKNGKWVRINKSSIDINKIFKELES